jgi:hypothetical protein
VSLVSLMDALGQGFQEIGIIIIEAFRRVDNDAWGCGMYRGPSGVGEVVQSRAHVGGSFKHGHGDQWGKPVHLDMHQL